MNPTQADSYLPYYHEYMSLDVTYTGGAGGATTPLPPPFPVITPM